MFSPLTYKQLLKTTLGTFDAYDLSVIEFLTNSIFRINLGRVFLNGPNKPERLSLECDVYPKEHAFGCQKVTPIKMFCLLSKTMLPKGVFYLLYLASSHQKKGFILTATRPFLFAMDICKCS